MELKINESFAKHYNEYRSKEEAAKTKKKLKREIKEIEQSSSSSSDSEFDLDYQNKFVEQCDKLLQEIESKGINVLKEPPTWENDLSSIKTTVKVEKPIFAKDLNRKILLDGGMENEVELHEIEQISKIDSDDIINNCGKPSDIIGDLENISEDENFFKPSSKPSKFVIKNIEKEDNEVESNLLYCEDDIVESIQQSEPGKIDINHDRKLKSVRVSKTKTRAEKRQTKKERKEKELKEKIKKLQEIKTRSLLEKIEKIKKVVPQAAEHLIFDQLDEDFNIDEISKKLTEFFDKEDANLPVDKEKPIFSDDSDLDDKEYPEGGEEQEEEEEEEFVERKKKSEEFVERKKKSEEFVERKKKSSFFTNLEVLENAAKKRTGLIKKNNEVFDPEKHANFSKYLKENFDFCCEDLILGKDDEDDILCKFKFRKVEKQDYGLDIEEIILADPKELNKWASLKKITRIRTKEEEEKDRIRYERKKEKKNEILKSIYRSESEEEEKLEREQEEVEDKQEKSEEKEVLSKASKKRLRKNEKKRKLQEMISGNDCEDSKEEQEGEPMLKKSKKTRSEVENAQEFSKIPEKSKKKEKIEENRINNEEFIKARTTTKRRKGEEITTEGESSNNNNTGECGGQGNRNDPSLPGRKDAQHHKKHNKSQKDKNRTSVPNLSNSRLEAIGIKSGYYKHVLRK